MEQEKNNKGVIALLAVIIVILLALVVLLVTGTISFKSNDKQSSEKANESVDNNANQSETGASTKLELTDTEISELNDFVADIVNSQMAFVSFSDPSKLLEAGDNSKYSYLTYIISRSKYAQDLKQENVPSYSIKLTDIKSLLKELTNYDYSEEEIKNYFNSSYNSEKDAYVINGGGAGMIGTITNSYKIGNNYYISLSNNANIVLVKVNNNYCFYSSTGTK